jgi:3-phytase
MRSGRVLQSPILALILTVPLGSAQGAELVAVEQELTEGGNNYDDPCFWQDPDDPGTAVACMTSKDDDLVECFRLPSGEFRGTATGFAGAANNCDVDPRRDELVTTDNGGARVLVHALPELGAPIRTLGSPELEDVTGICVGHDDGRSLVFVTDEETGKVYVFDSLTGAEVRSFPYDLVTAEGIACDDDRQRVYVCDDDSNDRSCRAFTYEGIAIPPEFGIEETGPDSEGVTIYRCGPEEGYIIVSDQSNDEFEVFDRREPFAHLCTFVLEHGGDRTDATDGIDVVQIPAYANGLFGACDGCGGSSDELDLVRWERIAEACGLRVCPLGAPAEDEPVCGDGMRNRPAEECDGGSDAACPGQCRADCTCAGSDDGGVDGGDDGGGNGGGGGAAPVCGDDRLNGDEEECDGADAALCPGECTVDCTCPAGTEAAAAVVADVTVRSAAPNRNLDGRLLEADARFAKQAFLKIRVRGVGNKRVERVRLRLTVGEPGKAKSNHGGEIYATSCDWEEGRLTWDERPETEGQAIDAQAGDRRPGDRVSFDLTGYVTGDGDYCLALTSPSTNAVRYESREMERGPVVQISVRNPDAPPRDDPADDPVDDPGNEPAGDPTDDSFSCLAGGADTVLTGLSTEAYYTRSMAAGEVIDARRASFVHCSQPDPASPCAENTYPVNLGSTSAPEACWSGGVVAGANRLDATWEEMHDPNNAGFIFENPTFTVQGIRIYNVGDGIRPRTGATDFSIRDVWLSAVRDDCVENDYMNGGIVADSLLDGCFVGFSARHSSPARSGAANLWTIERSLVRLEAMPGPPEGGDAGHKGFFKWTDWGDENSASPRLALYNNVFMAEQAGQVPADHMGIPPGKLADCADNVMVWLGPGDYPAALPSCFRVVKERSVWERARAEWIARHPGIPEP